MADGDIAAGLGWHIPSDYDDVNQGANEIRKALDIIATHVISGTHAMASITGLSTALNNRVLKTDLATRLIQETDGTALRSPNNATAVRADNDGRVYSINIYNNPVSGSGSFRQVYVNQNAALGYVPSLAALKQLSGDQSIDIEAWLELPLRRYFYKGDESEYVRLGWFAEEVHDIEPDITFTDDEGELAGIDYSAAVVPLLALVQHLAQRVAALEEKESN